MEFLNNFQASFFQENLSVIAFLKARLFILELKTYYQPRISDTEGKTRTLKNVPGKTSLK